MEITATVKLEIPQDALRELAADIITTAAEGGVNYWAEITEYRWGNPTLGHGNNDPWNDGDKAYAHMALVDKDDEDEDEPTVYAVNEATMTDVLVKLVSGELPGFGALSYRDTFRGRLVTAMGQMVANQVDSFIETDLDYDADDADNLVQLACFGKVVYG